MDLLTQPQASLFGRLARTYSWDMDAVEAQRWPLRLLRRVMDLGTLADIVAAERVFGPVLLTTALTTAEVGALRPQSWTFWHYRLGLVPAGDPCPPMPTRATG